MVYKHHTRPSLPIGTCPDCGKEEMPLTRTSKCIECDPWVEAVAADDEERDEILSEQETCCACGNTLGAADSIVFVPGFDWTFGWFPAHGDGTCLDTQGHGWIIG